MQREHRIRVTWSPDAVQHGLPDIVRSIDPAWRAGLVPTRDEGWSLTYRFDRSPRDQGNPSLGYAQFAMEDTPADWLVRGNTLLLFERATGKYATVEVLD